jgi:hypothetical protein
MDRSRPLTLHLTNSDHGDHPQIAASAGQSFEKKSWNSISPWSLMDTTGPSLGGEIVANEEPPAPESDKQDDERPESEQHLGSLLHSGHSS